MAYISDHLRALIREQAGDRCGYCLTQQQYTPTLLEIDHIQPVAKGGTDDEHNLWLCCRMCNGHKHTQTQAFDSVSGKTVTIFNPRLQVWNEHFKWSDDGLLIIGITDYGRATVTVLQLNNDLALRVRRNWMMVGWHPPKD